MNVQPQVVAGAVGHPTTVLLAFGGEGFFGAYRQKSPLLKACGDDLHCSIVNIAEACSRLVRAFECGLAGIQNRLIDLCLSGGEASIDGERAGDICGVKRIDLDACIDQNQVAFVHRAVVIDPVERIRVVSRGRNGVVAQTVAFFARDRSESTFDHALAAMVSHGAGEGPQDVFKTGLRDLDCATKFRNFELILAQANLGEAFLKCIIAFSGISTEGEACLEAHFVDHRFDGLVNVTDHAKSNASSILSQCIAQSINVLAAQTGFGCDFLKRGARAHPELAVARIRVELL